MNALSFSKALTLAEHEQGEIIGTQCGSTDVEQLVCLSRHNFEEERVKLADCGCTNFRELTNQAGRGYGWTLQNTYNPSVVPTTVPFTLSQRKERILCSPESSN